jgi:hypothetical protein
MPPLPATAMPPAAGTLTTTQKPEIFFSPKPGGYLAYVLYNKHTQERKMLMDHLDFSKKYSSSFGSFVTPLDQVLSTSVPATWLVAGAVMAGYPSNSKNPLLAEFITEGVVRQITLRYLASIRTCKLLGLSDPSTIVAQYDMGADLACSKEGMEFITIASDSIIQGKEKDLLASLEKELDYRMSVYEEVSCLRSGKTLVLSGGPRAIEHSGVKKVNSEEKPIFVNVAKKHQSLYSH